MGHRVYSMSHRLQQSIEGTRPAKNMGPASRPVPRILRPSSLHPGTDFQFRVPRNMRPSSFRPSGPAGRVP